MPSEAQLIPAIKVSATLEASLLCFKPQQPGPKLGQSCSGLPPAPAGSGMNRLDCSRFLSRQGQPLPEKFDADHMGACKVNRDVMFYSFTLIIAKRTHPFNLSNNKKEIITKELKVARIIEGIKEAYHHMEAFCVALAFSDEELSLEEGVRCKELLHISIMELWFSVHAFRSMIVYCQFAIKVIEILEEGLQRGILTSSTYDTSRLMDAPTL
ncbi:hypothetical protein IFM89_015307 [Coptis chinensis]|uniref:Uncharacterized protein n=1 Tax=Coptis chinensis TaxID=261450 RepID=A0A835IN89_9MAGN|nr:hypothetical protein IFM89_015307 [Coptis chinensis]